METVFKVAATAIVICLIYYQVLFVRALWRSQVDPKATVARLLEKLKPETQVIATRDPTRIYQNGTVIGEVRGEVTIEGNRVLFRQLLNTTGVKLDQPIEYQRLRLRIADRGQRIGNMTDMTDTGTIVAKDVLENVVCEKLP